jgi:hypothetical protein
LSQKLASTGNKHFQQSPDLLAQYEVDAFPKLPVANVRELLRASMPLQQLTPEEAAHLMVSHHVNRTR